MQSTSIIIASEQHLAERVASRPPEYLAEITSSIVFRGNGEIHFDSNHPAWKAAVKKYHPALDPAALANHRRATGGCNGCGDAPMEGM